MSFIDSIDSQTPRWWDQAVETSSVLLFIGGLTVVMTLILSFNLIAPTEITAVEGLPANNDVLAPRAINFTSTVLTSQAQEAASNSVAEVYTSFDSSIGRTQLTYATSVFGFIETVRADTRTPPNERIRYLQSINGLVIEEPVADGLLNISENSYLISKEEVLNVIDQLMREDIKEDQLRSFQTAARRTSPGLSQNEESIVSGLAWQFIVPTVFPNDEATAIARDEAIAAVEPQIRSVEQGQRILRAGDIITAADIELLRELGLLQEEVEILDIASLLLASLLASTLIALYWLQFHHKLKGTDRYLIALGSLIAVFTLIAKLMLSGPPFLLYWFPIATMSMLLTVMFEARLSMLVTVIMAALVGFIATNSVELVVYTAVGGLIAILMLQDAQRMTAFFRAGLVSAVGFMCVILIFRLPQANDSFELMQSLLFGLGNGVLSAALTLLGFYVLSSLFGVTTILQLQDLSRLDHPLLQEMLRRAPGTYHHSVVVANLAEQAAERINANSTLVRVGAFYHDIGKMNKPQFFIENQEGFNPHDNLDPKESADIVVGHVRDGLELARRYGLPDRIRDFIAEHHGDRLIKGFYYKARTQAGEGNEESVNPEQFRHMGPPPRSRETGIVMLADATESTSNAIRPNTERGIEKLVNGIVDEHVSEGQLDDSGLTLGDVRLIKASFIETLHGRFHVRVRYPGNEKLEVSEEESGNKKAAPPAASAEAAS